MHHRIEYPDGTVHEGKLDHRPDLETLKLTEIEGDVLDLATNDGFFAFWAESHGARSVTALDVGSYENYEWGFDGPPESVKNLPQQNKWEAFDFHHRNLKSTVKKVEMSVYDCPSLGRFDVIFNFGLLYHLRNPIGSLDACRKACRGYMALETAVAKSDVMACMMGQMETDYFLPSESCVIRWLEIACFPYIFKQTRWNGQRSRQRFVGVVDPKYLKHFRQNENMEEVRKP